MNSVDLISALTTNIAKPCFEAVLDGFESVPLDRAYMDAARSDDLVRLFAFSENIIIGTQVSHASLI